MYSFVCFIYLDSIQKGYRHTNIKYASGTRVMLLINIITLTMVPPLHSSFTLYNTDIYKWSLPRIDGRIYNTFTHMYV